MSEPRPWTLMPPPPGYYPVCAVEFDLEVGG